jgi:hypothetical protein
MVDMHHWRWWKNTLEAHGGFPPQRVRCHRGRASWPHLAGSQALPWCGVFWCPLEPSRVYATKISHDIFWYLGPLWRFSIVFIHFDHLWKKGWWFMVYFNYCQQVLTRRAHPLWYTLEKTPDRTRAFSSRLPSLSSYYHNTTAELR